MTRPPPPSPQVPLSSQVKGQRYFFLDLRSPAQGKATLAYGGFEQCDPDYLIQRDGFDFTVIELVASGEGLVVLDGQKHPLQPGTLFTYSISTKLEIRSSPTRQMTKYFLCFSGRSAERRLQAAGVPPGRVRHLPLFGEAQQLFEDIVREGRHGRAASSRICGTLAEVLLLKIEELGRWTGGSAKDGEEEFLACRTLIDRRFLELRTLEEITRAARTSSIRLCRLFRRYQGVSPYQYLLKRKMGHAAELLLGSAMLVKEVAEQVGYADPYHFSRCFKKVHRVSPREFQRSLQGR